FNLVVLKLLFLFAILFQLLFFFFFQAEDGIRYRNVTGVQTCALPISHSAAPRGAGARAAPPPRNRCPPGIPSPPRRAEAGVCTASTLRSVSSGASNAARARHLPNGRRPARGETPAAPRPRSRGRDRQARSASAAARRAAVRRPCGARRGGSPDLAPRASSRRRRPRY